MPLLSLIGLPSAPTRSAPAVGHRAARLRRARRRTARRPGPRRLAAAIDALDRELLGSTHPLDHRFLRQEGRHGWLYRGPDGEPVGYGYAAEAGRVGPVAVRDDALLGPILGHLTGGRDPPRGAFAHLGRRAPPAEAVVPALQAGFRLDPFPVLALLGPAVRGLRRYLPISPGLL